MNKRQKELLQLQLDNEKAVLKKLQGIYKKALDDVNDHIAALMGRTDIENLQSIVYQLNYQKALKTQINGILDTLASNQYTTISDYLANCYENGFIGTMYDLHGQGIPLLFPLNQDLVVRAVQNEAPLVDAFYDYLGEDVNLLKKRVANNISRGMAQGSSYAEIARNIERGMIGDYSKVNGGAMYDAYRIARTEGHRITNAATHDAQVKAKDAGADVVKQWDAAMDRRTRKSHARVDGEIREIDDTFSNGLMYPGDSAGSAAEVINCRCACLQRAKWALDDDELQMLKARAEFFGLDKTDSFEDFKQKYLAAAAEPEYNGVIKSDSSVFDGIISKQTGMNQSYKDVLNQRYSHGSTDAQKAFNKLVPSDSVADAAFTGTAHFNPATQKINMNFADDLQNKRGAGATFFHEHGHFIDFMAAGASNYDYLSTTSQTFGALLQSDFKEYVKTYKKQHKMKAADAYNAISLELLGHEKHSLSDLLDGISKGKCSGMYGHARSYWTNPGALEKEAFAHMFEASFDSDKYALMKQYFPNALAEFEKMLKRVI